MAIMEKIKVFVERTEEGKQLELPTYQTEHSAGMDLYACTHDTITLNPGEIKLIPTGIKIAILTVMRLKSDPEAALL